MSDDNSFRQLREALQAQGSAGATLLRLRPGSAVNADLVQKALDEIFKHNAVLAHLGEEETACMKLAKIVLSDSSFLL